MTNIESQYQISKAAELLRSLLSKQGQASIGSYAPDSRERWVNGVFSKASISLQLGCNQTNQVVLTALRINSEDFHYQGLSADFHIWEPKIDAAEFLVRSFLKDLSSGSKSLTCTFEALATFSDTICPHHVVIKLAAGMDSRQSLNGFLGAPTHVRFDPASQSTRFTYYIPVAAPVGGHFDVHAEVGRDATLVACQLISPNSKWHRRYFRIARSSDELIVLGRIILDAASPSSNQEERFRLLAQKMNYRDVPLIGAAILAQLKISRSADQIGVAAADTAALLKQLRPGAASQLDRYIVRRGLPFPVTLRRMYNNLPKVNGLNRPILYVHRAEELAVQVLRPSASGFSHVTAWWGDPGVTRAYDEIVQGIGRLTVSLATALPSLTEFQSAVRRSFTTQPSGFTFSDSGDLHPELTNVAELFTRGDPMETVVYRPETFAEALYCLLSGRQIRTLRVGHRLYELCHTPALTDEEFVLTAGELRIREERAGKELVVQSPLSRSDKALVTRFLSGDYSDSRSMSGGLKKRGANTLVNRFLSQLVVPDTYSGYPEAPFHKLQMGSRALYLCSKRVRVKIKAVSDDHVVARFYEIYDAVPRPKNGARYFQWLLKTVGLKILSLGPPAIRLEIFGSGVNWGEVSKLYHQIVTSLEAEFSKDRSSSLGYRDPGGRLFSMDASCRVIFSGFGWRSGFDSRDGRTVSFSGNYLMQTSKTEAIEAPPTVGAALKFLMNSMKAHGVF